MIHSNASDPRGDVPANPGWLDQRLLATLRDPRDLPLARSIVDITATMLPMTAFLYALPLLGAPWWVPLAFIPLQFGHVYMRYGGRYILLLHAICHRQTFKKPYEPLFRYVAWFLGPLFGCTPTSFYVHHIGMHHPENNTGTDLSSTVMYRRDSFAHFVHYWARFFFFAMPNLHRYLAQSGRTKLIRDLWTGEIAWAIVVAALLYVSPWPTVTVFLFPLFATRVLMMCGNFAQHAFVDVDDPDNAYRNSTCLINSRHNQRCYNDGYHIVHHIKPAMAWSEMAQWYADHEAEFAKQDAVVFTGIRDNQQVWFLLMRGNYDKLAEHLVDFKGRTHAEKVAFLKGRVQRTRGTLPSPFALSVDLAA